MYAQPRLAERSSLLNWPCLKLNADYRPLATFPLSIMPVRNAIEALIRGKAQVVEAYEGEFRSVSLRLPIPKVIVLRDYVNIFGEVKLTRWNVMVRDRFCCQYCGTRFESPQLTFDHVIPKSRGGQTTWDNVAMACMKCNGIKRDSWPNYSGRKRVAAPGHMRPLKTPRRPTAAELYRAGLEVLPEQHRTLFADYLSAHYWGAELQS